MIGCASASTLRDHWLVDLVGQQRARLRHPVAHVGGRAVGIAVTRKRTVIWLCSGRLIELRILDALDAREQSSSGWVTWLSMMSDEAPV